MALTDMIGQDRVVRLLKQGLASGRVAHAYCFTGPRGVGKAGAAMELAKALNCENQDGEACGKCRQCQRIEHRNHPGVRDLSPDGQTIKIDQVRRLQRDFAYSPAGGGTRVIIIRQAETMTLQAANSLLKFLEEPVSRMVAVLVTENVNAILPTILSRCQLLRFSSLAPDHIAQRLLEKGVDKDCARIASRLAGGIPEAEALAREDGFALLCERVIKWSGEIVSGKSDALLTIQMQLLNEEPSREQLERTLDLLLLWLRDLMYEQLGREGTVFIRYGDTRRRQASRWTFASLTKGMESVMEARRQLAGPVQPQAILEQMVLAMQGGSTHVISRRSPFQASG
ncbi:DNA polymerase III subunit delta' [Salinithrix halophila]|uniref:DNA polymerase III subunit delta n=1 Tax=Salinithrix halophila TaxID=1485204 RepID=A0ABV8J9L2_9BACL